MDSTLIVMLSNFFASFTQIAATIGMIAYASYWILIPFAVLGVLYFSFLNIFRGASRELKRLESITRSPVCTYNHLRLLSYLLPFSNTCTVNQFSETLSGISTIRAYDEQEHFYYTMSRKIDYYLRALYTTYMSQRWISFRLDIIGSLLVAASAILIVATKSSITLAVAAMGLNYTSQMTAVLSMTVRNFAEAESQLACVERISYYATNVPQEPPANVSNHKPPKEWPTSGKLEFENYSMKYREELPPVLNELNFTVNGGEKIGIVRTKVAAIVNTHTQ